jgi:hypothetical protein
MTRRENTMTEYKDIATRYIDSWNETDPEARRTRLQGLWTGDGRYTDPLADVQGIDGIDATIAAVRRQFPSFHFRLIGAVDGHGLQCRFAWELGPEGADAPVAGFDVVELTPEGKVQRVLGFLDRVPSAA